MIQEVIEILHMIGKKNVNFPLEFLRIQDQHQRQDKHNGCHHYHYYHRQIHISSKEKSQKNSHKKIK